MGKLDGKVAIITGAGSGIGLATARLFAREGARLMLVGRREALLIDAATACGEVATYRVGDVSQGADVEAYTRATVERFGGFDIVVCNAGIEGPLKPIEDYPIEEFDKLMAINVRGVFLGLQHAIPELKRRGAGSIVITSSIGGLKARGMGNSGYIASKHAELGLMRCAAMECAPHNIRVNAVCPGPTETPMMRAIEEHRMPGRGEEARKLSAAGVPLRRYGTPEEIANLILFLAGDDCGICTGAAFSADGGLAAM